MAASLFGTGGVTNANVQGSLVPQVFTATAGQTLFNLTAFTYSVGTGSLLVFINGSLQSLKDYAETSTGSFTLVEACLGGESILALGFPETTLDYNGVFATLASPAAGKGASLSGVEDAAGNFGGVTKNVESVLAAIVARAYGTSAMCKGATFDGTTDDTVLIQAAIDAIDGIMVLPPRTAKITAQLVVRNNCTGIVGHGQLNSQFDKRFNGEPIKVTNGGVMLLDFGIIGNGATYTGGGMYIEGNNVNAERIRIDGTADSCLIYKARAAVYSGARDCFLKPLTAGSVYAIRSDGADLSSGPTARTFDNIAGGNNLVDFSGMVAVNLTNSFGQLVRFDANCSKVKMQGNRLTNAASNVTVYGNDHQIIGNNLGFGVGYGLIIDSTAVNVVATPNVIIAGSSILQNVAVTTGGALTHTVDLTLADWSGSIVWTGSSAPISATIGNGSLASYYSVSGRLCTVVIDLTVGSTTTIPGGTWSFNLPFKAYVFASAAVLVKSSVPAYSVGVATVNGGGATLNIYLNAATAALKNGDVAFGTNAQIRLEIQYLIATS